MSGALAAQIPTSTELTLSGQSVTVVSTSPATAGVRINTDGTVDENKSGVYTQIDTATDWIRPARNASSSYQVRITNVVWTYGSAFDTEAAAENTWVALSANREWNVVDSTDGPLGVKSVAFDIEIRKGASGDALVSGSYSTTANYDSNPP